jgi:hypothetical protein
MASEASIFETGFSVISMFKIVGFFVEDRRDDFSLTTDPPFVGNAFMSRSTDDIFVTFRSDVVLSIVLFVFFVVDNVFPSHAPSCTPAKVDLAIHGTGIAFGRFDDFGIFTR